ncbi:RNA-binding protein 42-like [Mytilus trossulus]|uniref:RNA-binding protein 42-like n=1 Tax=Mytilus trossulus TaxID=6551 RepID=UPI003005883B
MAMITDQRLKEMEEEMSRFEQEILAPKGQGSKPHPMIIGSRTFTNVQARISSDPPSVGHPPPPPLRKPPTAPPGSKPAGPPSVSLPASVLAAPPPPPPALLPKPKDKLDMPPLAPPPPPPPAIRPAFVPHQVRHRPPPPRLPPHRFGPPGPGQYYGPPGGPGPHGFPGPHGPGPYGPGPHGPGPGPMPPYRGPGPMGGPAPPGPIGPGYGFSDGVQHMMANEGSGNIISSGPTGPPKEEKPKMVISAGPVINKPKLEKKKKNKKAKLETTVTETTTIVTPVDTGPKVVAGPTMPVELMGEEAISMEAETEDSTGKKKKDKKKKFIRTAAGQIWEDPSLEEWDPDDFRMFCGDLGNEVTDECLARAFSKYPTFVKARVLRDKRTNKTKGYGFVSFRDPQDFARAMREMNGKYVGNRPIKLRKSNWKDRNIEIVRKKEKEKKRLGLK